LPCIQRVTRGERASAIIQLCHSRFT
jgi:hypothetical protein